MNVDTNSGVICRLHTCASIVIVVIVSDNREAGGCSQHIRWLDRRIAPCGTTPKIRQQGIPRLVQETSRSNLLSCFFSINRQQINCDQTWGQIHLYLNTFSNYLYLTLRNEKHLYLNTFKYIVSINISVSWSLVMLAKLITFTANHLSPNKLFSTFKIPINCNINANYCRHLTAGVPRALTVTTTSVCSKPDDGLSTLFRLQAGTRLFCLSRWAATLPHKILAVLLWTSWLNLANKQLDVSKSVVTVM